MTADVPESRHEDDRGTENGSVGACRTRNVVVVSRAGPYQVDGDIRFRWTREGEERRESRLVLCRCGESGDKPYCDGSHRDAGFSDPGSLHPGRAEAERAPTEGDGRLDDGEAAFGRGEEGGGALRIRPRPDGPLKLEGWAEIRSADGRDRVRVTETALCRCGHSRQKPFCDGSHRDAGFRAGPDAARQAAG